MQKAMTIRPQQQTPPPRPAVRHARAAQPSAAAGDPWCPPTRHLQSACGELPTAMNLPVVSRQQSSGKAKALLHESISCVTYAYVRT